MSLWIPSKPTQIETSCGLVESGEFEDQTRQTACRVGQNEGMLRGKYSYMLISAIAHRKKSPEQQGTQHVLQHGEVGTNTDGRR